MKGGTASTTGTTVSVLGPPRIEREDADVQVGPRLTRLLAALVRHRGSVVGIDTLADIVWQGDPPKRAIGNLRSYVTRLRHALGAGDDPIEFRNDGYVLDASALVIDADEFERELDGAIAALRGADPESAEQLIDSALARWSGRAYGAFADEDWARPASVHLEERRNEAAELHVEILLATERIEPAIALARSLVETSPLRDRPRALLMRAMYMDGRQAEAIRVYDGYRTLLAEQTGLEPTAELADLEAGIVRGDLERSAPIAHVKGYELGARIGRGAFSVVHRALQPGVGREVAVKIIRSELADEPAFVRQFEHEAQLIASVEHPHVVPLYDFWRDPGAAYLVMRWMRAGSVAALLRERGPYSRQQVCRLLEQVGGALTAAHRRGVVHRDVRPANLLRDDEGATYVADFGLSSATTVDPALAPPGGGSLHYCAPELLRGEPVHASADVLSLGVTVFELLTGRLPFAESTDPVELVRRQIGEPLPSVRAIRTDLPNGVDDVLARATSKAREDRHVTVAELVDDLVAAIATTSERPTRPAATGPRPNPYVGLHAFTESDADRFHGRGRLVAELLDAVESRRLVVVVGPSGSGKSSVVRAGLIPAIRADGVPGSASWFVTTMFPGPDPFAALESALLRVAVNPPASLREQLAEPGGLLRAVRRVLPTHDATVLVVIDQFEELFTTVAKDDVRRRFLAELAAVVETPHAPIRVVATLRADHYDAPLADPALAEAVTAGTVTVRPMRPDELERAVVRPAASVGVEVQLALVAELIAMTGDHPGALPLLQFALTEVYERRPDDVMSLETYTSLGGMTGALAARAERIVDRGDGRDEALIRLIFARLVTVGAGGEGHHRRRAPLAEFGDDERTAWLIDEFVTARLLTVDRDAETRAPTLEVTHEALLREWPRLRDWIDEHRVDLRTHRRVTQAANEWDRSGGDTGGLARGGWLDLASDFAERRPDMLNDVERAWIERSQSVAAKDRAAEEAAAQRDRRQNRRLRRMLTTAAVLLVAALTATSVAYVQRSRAQENEAAAEARELLLEAERQFRDDPELAGLLGIESVAAFRDAGLEVPGSVGDLLRSAMVANRVVGRVPGGSYVQVSADGSRLITGSPDGGARVYDVTTMELIETIHPDPYDVQFAGFFGDEIFVFGGEGDGTETIVRRRDDSWEPVVSGLEFAVADPGWIEWNGPWLAIDQRGTMRVWNVAGPAEFDEPAWSTEVDPFTTLAISDDNRLALVDPSGAVRITDVASGETVTEFTPPIAAQWLAFSPNEQHLVVMEFNVAVTVVEIATGLPSWEPVELSRAVAVVWSGDGSRLLVGSPAGAIEIDAATGEPIDTMRHLAGFADIAVVPDTDIAFFAGFRDDHSDGTTVVLDLVPVRPDREVIDVLELGSPARWLEVDPAGRWLAAAGMSDSVAIDLATGRERFRTRGLPFGERSAIRDVNGATVPVLSSNGRYVAAPDADGWSELWSVDTGERLYRAQAGWDIRAVGNAGDRVLVFRNHTPDDPASARIVSIVDGTSIDVDTGPEVIRGYFTIDDRHVVLTREEAAVGIWDSTTGEAVTDLGDSVQLLEGHVDVAPSGESIAIGNWDGTLFLFDHEAVTGGVAPDDAIELVVPTHETFINPLQVSADGSMIATVPRDAAAGLWSGVDGTALGSFPVETADAGVAFHPTDPLLYLADGSTVYVHALDIDDLAEMARNDIVRDLTDLECRRFLKHDC